MVKYPQWIDSILLGTETTPAGVILISDIKPIIRPIFQKKWKLLLIKGHFEGDQFRPSEITGIKGTHYGTPRVMRKADRDFYLGHKSAWYKSVGDHMTSAKSSLDDADRYELEQADKLKRRGKA